MLFKKSGLGLQDPVKSANENYLSLLHTTRELIGAVTGERDKFPPPIPFWRSGKKFMTDKKAGMKPTIPNSRD